MNLKSSSIEDTYTFIEDDSMALNLISDVIEEMIDEVSIKVFVENISIDCLSSGYDCGLEVIYPLYTNKEHFYICCNNKPLIYSEEIIKEWVDIDEDNNYSIHCVVKHNNRGEDFLIQISINDNLLSVVPLDNTKEILEIYWDALNYFFARDTLNKKISC